MQHEAPPQRLRQRFDAEIYLRLDILLAHFFVAEPQEMEDALRQIGRYFVVVQVVPHRLGVRQLIRVPGHSCADRLDEHRISRYSGEDHNLCADQPVSREAP